MKRKTKSSQNGAISVFVMITMVFFLLTILGAYMISSKRAQAQTESIQLVEGQYYTENEENNVYRNKVADSASVIPIYTQQQLWSIGSEEAIEIEGKVYTFHEGSVYELKNDIIINIAEMEGAKGFDETKLNKNHYEIYYYYDGNYYIATQYSDGTTVKNLADGEPVLSASGDNFSNISSTTTGLVGKYYLFDYKYKNYYLKFDSLEENWTYSTLNTRDSVFEKTDPYNLIGKARKYSTYFSYSGSWRSQFRWKCWNDYL